MKLYITLISLLLIFSSTLAATQTHSVKHHKKQKHQLKTSSSSSASEFSVDKKILASNSQNVQVQQLIANAFRLSEWRLPYKFGSEDPRNGGMDCSGTIRYLLKYSNLNAPRQADGIYQWAWLKGKFYGVNAHHFSSFEFSKLTPGDLLFWTDTYKVNRDPPVTHVMLYLGKNRDNQPLMFGATSQGGRGKPNHGVGVFAFNLNQMDKKSRFIGYSCIPGLNCG